jgi:hypothetical protein
LSETSRRPAPIFIVGAMRSGTTLLRLMLNESPELSIPGESHFLAPLTRELPPRVRLSDEQRRHALDYITSQVEWQRDFDTTDEALREAVGDDRITFGELVDRLFRTEIAPTGKPRWGDKTPGYLFSMQRLLRHLPDAQFVAIVRDPRDTYLSLRRYDWVGTTTWSIGVYLRKCGWRVARAGRTLDPRQFTVVRYEDLVLDTEKTLRALCATLDLTYDDRMLSFFEHADENVQPWEFEIGAHTKLRRAVQPSDVGRWRREGDRRAVQEVEALTTEVIHDHGYQPSLTEGRARAVRLRARLRHEWSTRRPSRSSS